jgi:RecJ-like exonuclease
MAEQKATPRLKHEFPSCEACEGTGYHLTEKLPCETCQGTGRVIPADWAAQADALNEKDQAEVEPKQPTRSHSSYRDRG